jgi:hypothetical protein
MSVTDDILLRLDTIIELLQRTAEARSSAQLATSTRGVDITVKSYGDGALDVASEEVLVEYEHIRAELNARGIAQFEQTAKAVRA